MGKKFYNIDVQRLLKAYSNVYLLEKVLRRRRDEVYVKWLGFDASHNSWIHKNNIV
ncbi:hypothetical protein ALC56_03109 [Trachymyrmex septentrionalis]|uniref:Chromo domain-containing protein n=1 Tax=Trachymyrmex septentrionalis TaxID=34720 RepID=A0A151JZT5_9HYME|nr:hypothetical protein ALC56_03109 [Trachymyrmex septentrionalis]